MYTIQGAFCSSLAKIFPEQEAPAGNYKSATALKGEKFSFQFAYFADGNPWGKMLTCKAESELKHIRIRKVELSPVRYLGSFIDDDVISRSPGLYPDPLLDVDGPFRKAPGQWHSLWIDVEIPRTCKPGKYPIKFTIWNPDMPEEENGRLTKTFTLEVINAVLPPQKLIHTEWFHADCLATYYKVPVWSEEHWKIVESFMRSAASHGVNMLLTPVFTPPLDTLVGKERPTTQLVDVTYSRGEYSFDFSKLDRWVKLAKKCGITHFEISHLFTQWGCAFCPKIVAKVRGKEKRIFGWDTASDSPGYQKFLSAFLPALVKWLKARKLKDVTYFHCSDEPGVAHQETYKKAMDILLKYIKGFKICDALSSLEFYSKGLVGTPIIAENHIEPFVEAGVKPLWTYYCCSQLDKCSNRMLHMPSSRNRIMGALLYRYDVTGFLQWGFNFYYSQFSIGPIDPWNILEADNGFPPGDSFIVYPGENGKAVDSLRLEVFFQGLQDLRALQLLESKIGRKKIEALLDKATPGGRMYMTDYPRGEEAVLALREKINALIKKNA